MKHLAAASLISALLATSAYAAEMELSVATRTPFAKVVSSSGIGSKDARAEAIFTDKAMREQCEGYHQDKADIDACFADWRQTLTSKISVRADCVAGLLWTDDGKNRYVYAGEYPDAPPKTRWRYANGSMVPVGMASEAYPLDQNWGTLCPGSKPSTAKAVSAPTPRSSALVEPAGFPWNHNGSVVRVDPDSGVIAYDQPKASIRSVVQHGTPLFRGKLGYSGAVAGTAYAFKEGCDPAPYPVRGSYQKGNEQIVLRGAGPVRNGCEVVAYSDRSPHAVLKFVNVIRD